jgi:hypothetical protein
MNAYYPYKVTRRTGSQGSTGYYTYDPNYNVYSGDGTGVSGNEQVRVIVARYLQAASGEVGNPINRRTGTLVPPARLLSHYYNY